jgi:hypothetical protein
MKKIILTGAIVFVFTAFSCLVCAEGIGKIKVLHGDVRIERSGQASSALIGAPVYQNDLVITGKDGSVGLLFEDDSRISAGPNSVLALNQFNFDKTTDDGNFDVSLKKGTLSVISGKLTKKTPGAMKVMTPAAVLAVRGTEFSVKVDEIAEQEVQK